jgi:uncharacterized protein (DUF697 family)
MRLRVSVATLGALVHEVEMSAHVPRPLVVGGARELAAVLRRELGRGAAPGAVGAGDAPEGAAALLYVLGRDPTEEDDRALLRARRAAVPIVAVLVGPGDGVTYVPHVLATDVVRVPAGQGFPLDALGEALAARLGEAAAPVAARVPALRGAVSGGLVGLFSRKAAFQAVRRPASVRDALVVLAQARLVLRLAQAQGRHPGVERLPELAATVAASYGWRGVAREVLEVVPVAGRAVHGAVAYAGTRTLGEAVIRRFAAGSPGRRG